MTPSKKCSDLVKTQEGCILHPYKDQVGVWTIGWGCTYYPNGKSVRPDDPDLTQQQADKMLDWQIGMKAKGVNACILGLPVNQNQFDALVDFVYNLGLGALEKSTLLAKMRVDVNDPTIRDEFGKWIHAGKRVLDALVKRRQLEADLYFSPMQQ
jgi:lysozyme